MMLLIDTGRGTQAAARNGCPARTGATEANSATASIATATTTAAATTTNATILRANATSTATTEIWCPCTRF